MKKYFVIAILIIQSCFVSAQDPGILTESSSLAQINSYYSYVVNIFGSLPDEKLTLFRKALSKFTPLEMAESGLLKKALLVSESEYQRILSQNSNSPVNFFDTLTINELAEFAIKTPLDAFDEMISRSSDYYRALSKLDPIGQTRKHSVTKLFKFFLIERLRQ